MNPVPTTATLTALRALIWRSLHTDVRFGIVTDQNLPWPTLVERWQLYVRGDDAFAAALETPAFLRAERRRPVRPRSAR